MILGTEVSGLWHGVSCGFVLFLFCFVSNVGALLVFDLV